MRKLVIEVSINKEKQKEMNNKKLNNDHILP